MCSNLNVPFVVLYSFLSFSRWPPRLQPRLVLPSLVWAAFRRRHPLALCPSPVLPLHHLVLLLILLSPVVDPTSVSSDQKVVKWKIIVVKMVCYTLS